MNRLFIANCLLALLLLSAIASAILAYTYVRARGDQLRLQEQVNFVSRQRAYATALLNEALAYSKNHPELAGVIQELRTSGLPNNRTQSPIQSEGQE